jgi:cytochrome c peroxidase
VVDFYDRGGDPAGTFIGTKDALIHPLHLNAHQKADLIEFMKTLTGDPLPASLTTDTSKH